MYRLIFILLITPFLAKAQSVTGIVMDDTKEGLPSATVQILGSNMFALTDAFGKFTLDLRGSGDQLVVSYIGYTSDTLDATPGKFMQIILAESTTLDEVVIEGDKTFVDPNVTQTNEVILESELLKAACCNLAESFETNASVDVSYSDAVTGTRQIKMLGLDGKYVNLMREDVPMIRGLIATNGLTFVPGTWLQTIDVGKGAGSVVNGYESMSGQINLDFKKPEGKEKLYLNGYVNGMGRVEFNANYAGNISEKVSTAILGHTSFRSIDVDRNGDGFRDVPLSRQFNLFNRYRIQGDRVITQLGFQAMQEDKLGGQVGFNRNDDHETSSLYGIPLQSQRFEFFGKTGVLFPEKPYKGLGIIYSAAYNKRDDGFGRSSYQGEQTTGYANIIYQSIIGNSFHQYRTGASFLLDEYDERLNDSTFTRSERVPGAFFEYSFSGPHAWSFVAGLRADYHNLYGMILTPRFHTQYGLSEESSVRFGIGKGTRVPNAIAENTGLLASSRRFVVQEALRPEESWNIGGSLTHQFDVTGKPLTVTADYFHTNFINQLVVDRDQQVDAVHFYNLDGKSQANSFQLETKFEVVENLTAKAAYKYYKVNTTYQVNGLRSAPFIPQDRFFINLEYATYFDKWVFDWTGQWYGNQRIPDTDQNQQEFQVADQSPAFFVMNAQVRRTFRWGSIYLGGENLLDFRQLTPIIDPQDPFGSNFDATLVWGPVAGRTIYAGIRYRINKNN